MSVVVDDDTSQLTLCWQDLERSMPVDIAQRDPEFTVSRTLITRPKSARDL